MRRVVKVAFIGLVVAHGAIHLSGVTRSDSPWGDAAWLLGALILICAGGLLAARVSWWWLVAALGALTSEALVITAWPDARTGTLANALVLLGAAHGYASSGPRSLRTEYRRLARQALARPATGDRRNSP